MSGVKDFDRLSLFVYRAYWLPEKYIDGDTFVAMADVGFGSRHEVHVRLSGVYAPELRDPGGTQAKMALMKALNNADPLQRWNLRIISLQREIAHTQIKSFERYVCTVFVVTPDGILTDVRDLLNGG